MIAIYGYNGSQGIKIDIGMSLGFDNLSLEYYDRQSANVFISHSNLRIERFISMSLFIVMVDASS